MASADHCGSGVWPHKNLVTLLDLCVSSLRRGHANLLCIVPILSDDLRGESDVSRWNSPPSVAGPARASGPHTHSRTVAGRGGGQADDSSSMAAFRLLPPPPPPPMPPSLAVASVTTSPLMVLPAWPLAIQWGEARCRRGISIPLWHGRVAAQKTW